MHLKNNTIHLVTIKSMIEEYKKVHPEDDTLPATITSCIQWEQLEKAILEDNIEFLTLQRQRTPLRDVPTMEGKLSARPELGPVVDWCVAWIREARRAAVKKPTHKAMLEAWEAEKAKKPNDPFFNCMFTPKYAQDQCAIHWQHLKDYEKTMNAAAAAAAAAADAAAAAAAEPPPPPPPPPADDYILPPPLPADGARWR
jgi:hypothetical protein